MKYTKAVAFKLCFIYSYDFMFPETVSNHLQPMGETPPESEQLLFYLCQWISNWSVRITWRTYLSNHIAGPSPWFLIGRSGFGPENLQFKEVST